MEQHRLKHSAKSELNITLDNQYPWNIWQSGNSKGMDGEASPETCSNNSPVMDAFSSICLKPSAERSVTEGSMHHGARYFQQKECSMAWKQAAFPHTCWENDVAMHAYVCDFVGSFCKTDIETHCKKYISWKTYDGNPWWERRLVRSIWTTSWQQKESKWKTPWEKQDFETWYATVHQDLLAKYRNVYVNLCALVP